ncbi:uncharacterized protein LOC115213476 [Octopus sinensis]|uniref:Uncharacterized protein LOC115213476 n=1 Tax=Octopus sinensis TaxID=2607531 RepID=A0A6P7SIZ2_9MOLL|nr:uncharacterized protein LOC115213476 [Octopus sinensis]
MGTKMNLIYVVPFLFLAVVGSDEISEPEKEFRKCRDVLDNVASTNCQRALNIHLCTKMLNGRIGSRGKQELDRLKCKKEINICGIKDIRTCKQLKQNDLCSYLEGMKNCLYQQECTEHYKLLDKHYTDSCLKTPCHTNNVDNCKIQITEPKTKSTETMCPHLDSIYTCVLSNGRCKMPSDWQKKYSQYACESLCYKIPKPSLTGLKEKQKCDKLNSFKSALDGYNCKIPKDVEKEYKSSQCDIRCNNARSCTTKNNPDGSRDEMCRTISFMSKCKEDAKCPIPQIIHDLYALYECGTSCDGKVLSECVASLKRPFNSTREELCGYFREEGKCNEAANCKLAEKYMKLMECSGAANQNTVFAIIFSFLLAVQMLEKYISLS